MKNKWVLVYAVLAALNAFCAIRGSLVGNPMWVIALNIFACGWLSGIIFESLVEQNEC